ncbi:LOW QUALITY PROTEIN: uncharacterized protein LOC109837647 [Asparagus officinalis]|uniref:LOW QUALITY PROTEIN: uncharacterized protein LOC109837647 n=1 Tax=Asparagus officinalis TaxID=4686 RepID=UPI00098E082C|nr:LOW QUALITY PROTEIN: uncharacterized protein LOC109837647 [Asparagus officinalis]
MAPPPICPPNSFLYNSTLCACDPGYYFTINTTCVAFDAPAGDFVVVNSAVEHNGPTFLNSMLPLDALRRLTQPQATELIGATLVTILLWLVFCLVVRIGRLDGGETVWFRLRWWISRLDYCFATKHFVEDLKVVKKRKTELGGTFSVASWILFVGLLSALLYQVITRRSIEVHRVRPANAPDLLSFVNDMEFNITAISSMSCSHLRGLDKLVIGTPGSIYFRVHPLASYTNYSCYNTSRGPTISFKCNRCKVPSEDHYISWQFVDLANDPATAVGFQFNLTAKAHGDDRHLSFVSGTLKSGSSRNDCPQTFRGQDMNILKIHLFPQKFTYLHNLRLIQPLLHDFLPGSSFSDVGDLRASLQSSKGGVVNTTLYISYLSDYIVEVDKQKIVGIVSFLADVGGLYTISLAIFLYFLLQCEARFKKLRNEDTIMRSIRSQRRAQRRWDTLRKYVNYTWGRSNLNMKRSSKRHDGLLPVPLCGVGSLHKLKQPSRRSSIYHDKMADTPNQTNFAPDAVYTGIIKSITGTTTNFEGGSLPSEHEHEMNDVAKDG